MTAEPEIDLHHHGDAEVGANLMDFAVNVRLPGPPTWLRRHLVEALDTLGSYPDPRRARAAVARRHGRPEQEVLLTAGAAEAFVLLARALHPHRAVCVHPSFTEPEAALRAAGHRVERAVLPYPFVLQEASVPEDADLVVLGNPTNPTSVLHSASQVAALARPGRVLVVDEAFCDTVPGEPDSLASRRELPGLLVVRSLTKTWGLAGLRIGYVLGAAPLLEQLAAQQPLWSVSALALVAAEQCNTPAALAEADRAAQDLVGRRARMEASLSQLDDVQVVPGGRSSFLLVQVPEGAAVRVRLRAAGIAVRRGDSFPGLGPAWLRLAVRRDEANRTLVTALACALQSATRYHNI
jgi:histidinol-phosphate aminotransferase